MPSPLLAPERRETEGDNPGTLRLPPPDELLSEVNDQ